jgi:hypothetical protein
MVAGAGAASVVMALVSHGVAGADALSDVTGKYYGQAKQVLSSAGLTPVVATRVGDQVGDDDCVIDRIQHADFLGGAGAAVSNRVFVHLNCYANVASPDEAGYSRQSQLGRAAYEAQQQAAAQAQAEAEAEAQQQAESEQDVTAENQR